MAEWLQNNGIVEVEKNNDNVEVETSLNFSNTQ